MARPWNSATHWPNPVFSKVRTTLRKNLLDGTAERPDYAQQSDQSLANLAQAAGEHPVETWPQRSLNPRAKVSYLRFVNEDLSALPDYMGSDWVVPALEMLALMSV